MSSIEQAITEAATRMWVNHRRHDPESRPPNAGELGLNLYWQGDRWYASVDRWPARTPGRREGAYGASSTAALAALLGKLRRGY